MKRILFLIISLTLFSFSEPNHFNEDIRANYFQSIDNSSKALQFNQYVSKFQNESAFILAYKGMAKFMLCKHAESVYEKYHKFNEGKVLLELAIQKEPTNIEFIYLRYTVQQNTPSLLNYSSEINDDLAKLKQYLLKQKSNQQDWLWNAIYDYLSVSQKINSKEKELLSKI
jgi:hypothetical protein